MKVVIVEDENLIAKNLQLQLRQLDPSIEVLAILDSVAGAVKWLKEHQHPDLFFMDIQLSDGVSFDIFKKVIIERPIVFTTAYNEYAVRAFKVNSIDYLLKPVDREQLQKALDKFRKYHTPSSDIFSEQLKGLISTVANPEGKKYKERFLAHYKAGIVPLPESKVAYFIKDTLIYLVTTDNEKLVTDYYTIDEIEEVVNPQKFFRANRQTLIQVEQVGAYKKHDTGKIELRMKCDGNVRIDVSREKASDFVNWIDS